MYRRTDGARRETSGDGKTAFKKKRREFTPTADRDEKTGRGGEKRVEEATCERQSSSACQTSVIDHKPTHHRAAEVYHLTGALPSPPYTFSYTDTVYMYV